ncbi:MAG: hypothetical protein R3246_17415, partial [Acidimicrobiia bacterium]|nr:hypothetical protein [Acidimicrobiia bacterium]
VAEVVAPGLIERRLVDGEGTVAAPVADLLTVVGSPHLVARAAYESGGEMEVRAFTARPEMAVEQRRLADGRVRFSPFDRAQLVPRILEFVLPNRVAESVDGDSGAVGGGGQDGDAAPPLVIDCSVAVLEAIFASDPTSVETTTAILVSDDVAPAAADLFATAVSSIQATGSVTMLHRPIDDAIHGVELTWMDAGDNGLWLTEPSSDPGRRSIERITMQQLASRLTDLLP